MRPSCRVLFALSCASLCVSVVQASDWAATFAFGSVYSVEPTADGGFVAAGETGGGTLSDVWVFKLDRLGKVVWQRTYGGLAGDRAYNIRTTADGGYVVAGFTGYAGAAGTRDGWVLKLDASGDVVWRKVYGGAGDDDILSIDPTSDGGYVLAGATYLTGSSEKAWVLKLDATGNVIWQTTYGGAFNDAALSVRQTPDGGYIVAGYTWSFGAGGSDAWVLKLDAGGNVLWQKTYGGAGNEVAMSVVPSGGGGYVVAGQTNSFGAGDSDAWVLKLDATGTVVWQKTYGEAGYESAASIAATADGGYVVAGQRDQAAWFFKIDDGGNIVWQHTYSGASPYAAYSVRPTSDAGHVIAVDFTTATVLKVDADGAIGGCNNVGTSSAVAASSHAVAGNSAATSAATNVTPTSGPLSQASPSTASSLPCFFAGGGPTVSAADVPTLSPWTTALLAGLLGVCAAAMRRRAR